MNEQPTQAQGSNRFLQWYRNAERGPKAFVWIAGIIIALVLIGSLSGTSADEPSAQSKQLDEENSELRAENRKLQAQVDDLSSENADLQSRVDDLEADNSSLKNQLENAEAQASNQNQQAAAPQQQAAQPSGTKHVRVEVSCDIPCDVMIMDDNFEFDIAEEITGTETFEADIKANSGLLAAASNLNQSGNLYVAVYENGELVAEDSDSQYAQVMY
jgi:TolA-binding protein